MTVGELSAFILYSIQSAAGLAQVAGRGLHSYPFQLNLRSSVQRVTQFNS
jgi:hypothetical protein